MTSVREVISKADRLTADLVFLGHFPQHLDAVRLRDKLSLARAEKPEVFSQARAKAMNDPWYAHRRVQDGHSWQVATTEFQSRPVFRAVCSCGFHGGSWRPEFGPKPEASQEDIRAAVYR